ncbi:MAG: hypothetical protein VYD11_02175 [Actinomycetota bacterium]|nr:hypothetical protein [Actinomycetota bacterium]MED5233234.1 hypothetical protein [Actinomycetota bacterium]MEE3354250.1 hypothetical protein [Actinomycetota bacterium]
MTHRILRAWSSMTPIRWIFVLTGLGFMIRLAYVLFVERGDPLSGDGVYYHEAANLLADGLGFTEPYRYLHGGAQETLFVADPSTILTTANTALPVGHIEPTAGHTPLWVLLLGAFSTLGFTSVIAHQLVGALTGAMGVAAVGWAGRQLDDHLGYRLIGPSAAAIAAIHAGFWLNDGLVMSESLVVPITALLLGMAVRTSRDPAIRNVLLLGIVGGLAALTRAELLLALPVLAIPLLTGRHLRQDGPSTVIRLRRYVTVGLVAAAVMAPWVIRNLTVFDEPVWLSNGSGILIAQTNCHDTYYGEKQGAWRFECALPQPLGAEGQAVDESVRDGEYRRRGIDYLTDHPRRFATHVVPKRIGRYWGLYAPIGQLQADTLVEGRSFRLSVLGFAQFTAVAILAAIGAREVRRLRGPLMLLATLPIVGTLVAAATMGATRYRVPAEVALTLLASVVLASWGQRRSIRKPATLD